MTGEAGETLRRFRAAFRESPVAAYRDWFRMQEELREREDAARSRALADDLWTLLPELEFSTEEERAKFFHNVAVFFGSPGPAADLARAREAFAVAFAHFREHEESGWLARAFHNCATSLSNLGETSQDLAESVTLFGRALEWRNSEREIARGVTLHNMGIALRRLAGLDASARDFHLRKSADSLKEAAEIRGRHRLAEGYALSLFHLALSLELLGEVTAAREAFLHAADSFDELGKHDSADIARERAKQA